MTANNGMKVRDVMRTDVVMIDRVATVADAILQMASAMAFSTYLLDELTFWDKVVVTPTLRIEHITTRLDDELAGKQTDGEQ